MYIVSVKFVFVFCFRRPCHSLSNEPPQKKPKSNFRCTQPFAIKISVNINVISPELTCYFLFVQGRVPARKSRFDCMHLAFGGFKIKKLFFNDFSTTRSLLNLKIVLPMHIFAHPDPLHPSVVPMVHSYQVFPFSPVQSVRLRHS